MRDGAFFGGMTPARVSLLGHERNVGVHNDHPELGLVEHGLISIGWDELGDLTAYDGDKDALKAKVAETYTDAKAAPSRSGRECRTGSPTR
jgi:hypothetical protein